MSRLKRLISEIHHRSLWQVLLIYVGGALIAYQAVQALTEGLGLPDWFPGLAVVLFIVLLPVVLATAFFKDGEPPTTSSDPTLIPVREAHPEAARRRRLLTWRNAVASFVVALAVWGIVAAGWYLLADRAEPEQMEAAGETRKSIAVLPFENLSSDPENEFFTDGMHDEIIAQLFKIADLKVISRTSVMEYKGRSENLRTIAEELGVTNILEGTVRRADGRVRITTQLIDALADEHVWAEVYDRNLSDVFAVQSDVAEQVATALRATLTPAERERIEERPTENLEAYDNWLRGNIYSARNLVEEDARTAAEYYERATELDPSFAIAYASLARARMWISWNFGGEDQLAAGEEALARALQLDANRPEVRLAKGWGHYVRRELDEALEDFASIRRQRPNHVPTLELLGYTYRRLSRFEEASTALREALELDPRNHTLAYGLARTYVSMRQYAKADTYFDRAISLLPDEANQYARTALLYLSWHGDRQQARQILQQAADRVSPAELWIGYGGYYKRMLRRVFSDDFAEVSDRISLQSPGVDAIAYFLAKAELAERGERLQAARAYYDSAGLAFQASSPLAAVGGFRSEQRGVIYAGLGRKEDAIRAGELDVESAPFTRDSWDGPSRLLRLVEVYVAVGEYDAAIDQLEILLSIPSELSANLVRLDPIYDPLRDHPRFQALLEKYQ